MQRTEITVDGMTCGHCVAAVSSEIGKIPSVTDVRVELQPGGPSAVVIASSEPVAPEQLAAAVDAAGYAIAE